MEESYRITDPQVLKVVAHPLRVRILGLLRSDGPATASQLGRLVGESSGSTSYHLRELAKYGFIEEDPSPDGRERRWRARHRYTSWDAGEMSATPEGREADRIMQLRQVESLSRAVEENADADWPREWAEAVGMSDHLVHLPAEGLKEFQDRVGELVREIEGRYAGHRDARPVHLWAGGYRRSL